MIPVVLVSGGRVLRIEWTDDDVDARMMGRSWLNGARVAFAQPAGFPTARTPAVYFPTLDGLEGVPGAVREQIESLLMEA